MRWFEHAVWWQVYPLGFTGAEQSALPASAPAVPRLGMLGGWLDYLTDLGCNGLALGPVFAAETHGYDTVDHFRIDPRLGDEPDLLDLVRQAHERGVRVLLDGVFNHVGRGFPRFADVRENGERSAFASWFRRSPAGEFETFEGHEKLVALNHDEPAVADYVTDVLTHWLARGIDGWRLDAAYAVPLAFWRNVTDRVRARFPAAWLLGEVIHGDYIAYVTDGGLDSVTQYELWKAIWSSCNDRNFFELAWALQRHNEMLATFAPSTFLGNHDVTRIASMLADERHLEHVLVLLATLGGVPCIYYGDEQAFRGEKEQREGGDDAIRPAFPAGPGELAPYGWPHYRLHQFLIGFRRRHPWLVRARTEVAELTNTLLAYVATDGEHRIAAVLNLADEPARASLPSGEWQVAGEHGGIEQGRAAVPAAGWLLAEPAA